MFRSDNVSDALGSGGVRDMTSSSVSYHEWPLGARPPGPAPDASPLRHSTFLLLPANARREPLLSVVAIRSMAEPLRRRFSAEFHAFQGLLHLVSLPRY